MSHKKRTIKMKSIEIDWLQGKHENFTAQTSKARKNEESACILFNWIYSLITKKFQNKKILKRLWQELKPTSGYPFVTWERQWSQGRGAKFKSHGTLHYGLLYHVNADYSSKLRTDQTKAIAYRKTETEITQKNWRDRNHNMLQI